MGSDSAKSEARKGKQPRNKQLAVCYEINCENYIKTIICLLFIYSPIDKYNPYSCNTVQGDGIVSPVVYV